MTFLYLGRRGAFGRFALELMRAAQASDRLSARLISSRQNDLSGDLAGLGAAVVPIDTFARAASPAIVTRFWAARRAILADLACERPAAVVTLMPHLWTPLIAPAIRRLAIPYLTIVHDAVPHPGDATAVLTRWLLRDADHADRVLTLSAAVARQLSETGRCAPERTRALFLPDIAYGVPALPRTLPQGKPCRLLFFGRIMAYKGLDVLIAAMERLAAAGVAVTLTVAGSGDLGPRRARLAALGAEIVNRWIADSEVGPLLARHDVMVCAHLEASQSGVAAAAFAAAMPVVGVPVGGIAEQVVDGATGVLADRAEAGALAAAIRRIATDPVLFAGISAHLAATAPARSMDRFVALIAEAVAAPRSPPG